MKVALPKILLGFKDVGVPDRGDAYMRHDLASSLALEILFGRSSDLFQELYESGLILDDFGASYGLGAGVGHGVVGGETPEPDRLREILLGRISSLLDSGISPEDFERTKRSYTGSFVRGFNSLEYIAGNYTHCQFHDFDLFRSVDLLAALGREEVEERIRALLDPGNHAAVVIVPA
jgi:predicted Zn-dependent peptidase